jgi:release factor glutamine methyltransferase
MSKVLHVEQENPSAEAINLAAGVLRDGGIVVFPTDTVYGIGASSSSWYGPLEIFEVKVRPLDKPLPWLVEGEGALDVYGADVPDYAHKLALRFWPGPLTIVVKAAAGVPKEFRDDRGTIALRCPDSEVVRELIMASGAPIAATSANSSGARPARNYFELEDRIKAAADVVLDGGSTSHGVPSSVIDCTGPEPLIVREGAVPGIDILHTAHGDDN